MVYCGMMVIVNREAVGTRKKRNGYSRKTRVEIPIFRARVSQRKTRKPKKVFHIPGLLKREV